jgi:hypothetical protein
MTLDSATAPTDPGQRYPSLSSFYLADQRRIASREVDVGLWWREGEKGALHRAAWVRDTGELYLVRLGSPAEGGAVVELLATVADEQRLQRALRGWREQCGQADSLSWLRERAASLRERARDLQLKIACAAAGVATASLAVFASAL